MTQIRLAEQRGHVKNNWLDTYHSFSFNTYYDSRFMGFRSLRVINDDTIQPGQGFGTHPHHDMEIITYVLDGELEHRDSLGNGSIIRAGDVQRMSAGSGVLHSEFNPSESNLVRLLQIWIVPSEKNIKPSYEQKSYSRQEKLGRLCLIASNVGQHGSLALYQDVNLYATVLEKGVQVTMTPGPDRYVWLQVARGRVVLHDHDLKVGDGVSMAGGQEIQLTGVDDAELLLFDLA